LRASTLKRELQHLLWLGRAVPFRAHALRRNGTEAVPYSRESQDQAS
jgi:hypothetical protein